ncbi:MAG: Serine/threonine-protein kinase PknA [Candidatus Anoxychlamydiales bacterium]|nr:Serine/threonine-protein kinase PknA [Candidatus Anoxychlamydiales bacterium]
MSVFSIKNSLTCITDFEKTNILLSEEQIILISKIASSRLSSTQIQFQILKKDSPIGHKIHAFRSKEGDIHVFVKDNDETNRQDSLGTNKSFCSSTYICIRKNKPLSIIRKGRLKAKVPSPFDSEYYSLNVQSLLREVKLTQTLNHPNIVSYSDFLIFESSDEIKKVYAYAPIFENDIFLLAKNDFPKMSEELKREFILSLSKQILQALVYLHNKGIIHNDIKHKNIYYSNIEGKYHFALGDFGLANKEINGDFKGSLEFLSPEKAISKGFIKKDYVDTGFATDLWDLGIIIYLLKEGKFNLFSKLMRKQFELNNLIKLKTYFYVENASEILEKLRKEEGDCFVQLLDSWISCLTTDTKKCDEMEKWIMRTIKIIKQKASIELDRMGTELIENDLINCILGHLLQPDPSKRATAKEALTILEKEI